MSSKEKKCDFKQEMRCQKWPNKYLRAQLEVDSRASRMLSTPGAWAVSGASSKEQGDSICVLTVAVLRARMVSGPSAQEHLK